MAILTHILFVQILILSLFSFSHSIIPGKPTNPYKSPQSSLNATYKIKYFTQNVDHFDYTPQSYETFQQRYLINTKEWGGVKIGSPIFVYIGEQDNIEFIARNEQFMFEINKIFQSLLVFIEHRYYGKSIPFDGKKLEYKNSRAFAYLNTPQALADIATLVTDLKKNLTAIDCPVMVFGSAYGGILATWFRLKYPHVAHGALASSAPILSFDNPISAYKFTDIISKNIKSESKNCYNVIKNSWSEMEKIIKRRGGISRLAKSLKICNPLPSKEVFQDRLFGLLEFSFISASLSDYPLNSNIRIPLPSYPVKKMCEAIDNPLLGHDTALKLYGALNAYYNFTRKESCFNLHFKDNDTRSTTAWEWQECTELVGSDLQNSADSIFPTTYKHLLKTLNKNCRKLNVTQRPDFITTEFGGHVDIKRVLKRFGSNIIFFNGLRDPVSAGGVLESISESVVAIVARHGAHNVDLLFSQKNAPKWLEKVRNREINIIRKWIEQYDHDNYAA